MTRPELAAIEARIKASAGSLGIVLNDRMELFFYARELEALVRDQVALLAGHAFTDATIHENDECVECGQCRPSHWPRCKLAAALARAAALLGSAEGGTRNG